MSFELTNLQPAPIPAQNIEVSEIWGASLKLEKGEYIQVYAPSGKGKSTFIQILYGNRTDYSGKARFKGELLCGFNRSKWAKLRQSTLSIVFQELLLFSQLTGLENLMLKSKLTNYYDQAKIKSLAKRLDVERLLQKRCGEMSFGERQRIAIIRSLLQPFDWLLMDEPFSHLDEGNTRLACEMITEECKQREAGLIITSLGQDELIDYDKRFLL